MLEQSTHQIDKKPYLLGLVGNLAGRKFFIEQEQVTIGRDASQCNIVLEHMLISRCHAMIRFDNQGIATITDFESSQGTFVNEKSIKEQILNDGDRVGFGPGGVVSFTYHSLNHKEGKKIQKTSTPQANVLKEQLIVAAQKAATGPVRPSSITSVTALTSQNFHSSDKNVINIGRSPDNDIVIDSPGISRRQASLTYRDGLAPLLADLGSTNGTFVDGKLLTEPCPVNPSNMIIMGSFLLCVDGRKVKQYDLSTSRITALGITKKVGKTTILKDISLSLYPREFIGLMGPSGCGKSTLMDALNGFRPASDGMVLINELDLYSNFNALRRSIGHVPQRDILHDALTVERTLYYAAKLRMPTGTSSEQMQSIINEVIETVGLKERRLTQFHQLSGGQQKRLSLALELITKPSFIFLDEPTSPLDPETTENMMLLFRRLADEGRIVVMVTHKFEKFEEMHNVAILTVGGRLAFFGPPKEALEFFGCREPGEIYKQIGGADPDELNRNFTSSKKYQQYVAERLTEAKEVVARTKNLTQKNTSSRGGSGAFNINQWITLTQRYLEVKLKDTRNTVILLGQAPVIALLAVITSNVLNDAKMLFIAAIISFWFGTNNAIREIVAEVPIYTRERMVNLKIPSYVFSKFAVLSGIALIQCILFLVVLTWFGRLDSKDFPVLLLIVYLTSLGGVTMGLFFSALVNSTEKAMSLLPLILIPQLLLSGFLKPLDDLYINMRTQKPDTAAAYQKFEDAKNTKPRVPQQVEQTPPIQPKGPESRNTPSIQNKSATQSLIVPPDPVTKYDGLGNASFVTTIMLVRWSIEALAHAVSINDEKARDQLATRITVTEYNNVLDKKPDKEITDAYRDHVIEDVSIISGFMALFLFLTMAALKRKDVL